MVDQGLSRIALPVRSLRAANPERSPRAARPQLRHFIVGPENSLLSVVLDAILQDGSPHWNPIVLYGPIGIGKSHLASGVVLHFTRGEASPKALYQTATEFASDYQEAITRGRANAFLQKFEKLELWAIDDIEGIVDSPNIQDVICRLLDDCVARQARVIVTCRLIPQAYDNLSSALRSRLSGGLGVPIVLPAEDARQAICEQIALERGIALQPALVALLATKLVGGALELDGALVHLEATARAEDRPIQLEDVERYVAERASPPKPQLRQIANETAKHFDLKLSDLRGESRRQNVVTARGVAMHLARELTGRSLQQIGEYFGGRDHSTVLHACRKTTQRMERDPAAARAVAILRQKLVRV